MFGLKALLPALLVAAFVVAAPSGASTPPTSTLTVPTTIGQTVSSSWTGTVLPGANATSNCTGAGASVSDEHAVTVYVGAGTYDSLTADWRFSISWTDPAPENRPSDLILTVVGPDGQVVGSSDGGSSTEVVAAENLPGGTYRVLACAFSSVVPIDYDGKLEISTRTPDPELASAPAQGLEFSASVAADNQRDESEPLVEIDRAGNIYGCGPTGSSQAQDYIQVSTDGGDSYHLLGTPPRGQSEGGGGGDCAVAHGLTPNADGKYDLAFTGLGPLTGFATGISPDNGHRIATAGGDVTGGVTNQGGVADRQWQTFVSATDVLLIYNQQAPRNTVVLRSTDKGLTFNPATAVVGAASPRFPGPIRYDDARDVVYFAWDDTGTLQGQAGDFVNLSISKDRGLTWTMCRVDFVEGNVPLFPTADHDSAGNIYVGYGDTGGYHTYLKALPQANVEKCNKPATTTAPNGTDPGFGPRIQVDRDAVRTTVFPWVAAGGAPGRVAMTFLGTETQGDPNVGTFKASWDTYVNVSLNALSRDPLDPPTFSQVKATTHPMHYDSICLNGLGCDLAVPPGDRSMADFMAIAYNRVTDKLTVIYNRANKVPDEAAGHVASPMAATQNGGPTLGGGTLTATRPTVRTSSTDPSGDALSSYSITAPAVVPPAPATANEPAADYASVDVGPEVDLVTGAALPDGGFTVTMRVADLSGPSLLATLGRTQSQSLLWIFRFTNGHQDAAASARWNPVQGFTFGFNDYATGTTPCASPAGSGEKCLLYPGDQPIQGAVDQDTGTIRLSVPRFLLRALSGGTGHRERPAEVGATVGSRFYDATAWSVGNTLSPVQTVQSFLYPFDNAPSMDFLLPAAGGGGGGTATGCNVRGGGSIAAPGGGAGKFSFNAHPGVPPKGHVAYRDGSTDFNSTTITSVTCDGSKGTVLGSGKNGNDSVSFRLEVVDGSPDTFSLTLTPGGARAGNLNKGNVHVG
jgi:hypothetical protein